MSHQPTVSRLDEAHSTGDPLHHWADLARHWKRVGSPLRPTDEDIRRLAAVWRQTLPASLVPGRRLEILLLGVTPEIAEHRWAPDFFLTAADANEGMIRSVWPGDGAHRRAVLGDWRTLPVEAGSIDLVLSDCGVNMFVEPGSVAALGRELRRVLRTDGRVAMRRYSRPVPTQTPADLVELVRRRQIVGFNELKLRLLMALESPGAGVRLDEVWTCFQGVFPDRVALADQLGCSGETIDTIDAYRDRPSRYAFPSLGELVDAFGDFSLVTGPSASYPCGECCPVFALVPRA